MKTQKLKTKKIFNKGLLLSSLLLVSTQASAITVPLCVATTTKTMPDGVVVTMWGFGNDVTPLGACAATVPGPEIVVPANDTNLTITVRNTLTTEPVSLMIPGLSSPAAAAPSLVPVTNTNGRMRSFTHETATGATGTYVFNAQPGTYLYQSGTNIAKQMQMGLYGAAIKNNSAYTPAVIANPAAIPPVVGSPEVLATAYPGVSYHQSVTALYSEIDPALHAAVVAGTYGTGAYTSTINYSPKYYMVNGVSYIPSATATPVIANVRPNAKLVLRFLNAGLETHVPVINGYHVDIVAEYGKQYPFSRKQYSVMLPAGQTRDAIMVASGVAGQIVFYDRRMRLTNNAEAGEGGLYSVVSVSGIPFALNAFDPTNVNASGISTGGGCTLQKTSGIDPLFPLLMLLSGLFFIRRSMKN